MATAAVPIFWEASGSEFSCFSNRGNCCLATSPSRIVGFRRGQKCRILCRKSSGFTFGTRKTNKDEENEDDSNGALNFGTQLLRFGSKKENLTTSLTKKDGTRKELSLSLGRLRRAPDSKTVFVAGATGQIGARISQQLLRNGFTVRGGVRDLYFAQQLAEFATQYGVISRDEARKVNAVEFDFKDVESIAKAIGNAGKVVVTVGPTEDGPRGKVTPKDALQVVEAANLANVGHVVIVTEAPGGLSNNGPFAIISGFFSKLFNKAAEVTTDSLLDSVVDTDLRFTFLKASSTEGMDDFSPDGESILLLSEGTYNQGTGKASKAQIASVVASICANISIAENKVLEVATINSEAPKPIEELLSSIPVDGRRAALAEARAKAEAQERERQTKEQAEAEAKQALEEAKKAAQVANELEQEAKRLAAEEAQASANAQKAKDRAKAAATSLEGMGDIALDEQGGSESSGSGLDGIGSFFKKTLAGRTTKGRQDDSQEEEKQGKEEEEKPTFALGNIFARASTVATQAVKPKPSSAAIKKPSPAAVKKPISTSPAAVKKPISKPSPAQAVKKPIPKPPPRQAKEQPKSRSKVMGGLIKQETTYVDE